MAGRITNGLELSKQSWGALRQNKQLVAFPVISMIGIAIITILFFIPEALILGTILEASQTGVWASSLSWTLAALIFFLYHLVAYAVVIFSNTALVGATLKMINGETED